MLPSSDLPLALYLPGLDGTGRLLHRQPGLHVAYRVEALSYPQDRFADYAELAGLAAGRIAAAGGPAVVVAESFGGAVALTLALLYPAAVSRLVLVNTFAWYPHRLRVMLGALLGPYLPNSPSPPRSRGPRGWFFFAPEIPRAERDEWWDRTSDVPMRAFGYRMRLLRGLDLRPRLAEIHTPALVIAAPNDKVVPARAGRELARLLPRAKLLLKRVGHAALIHPSLDVAKLLADPVYWPGLGPEAICPKAPG